MWLQLCFVAYLGIICGVLFCPGFHLFHPGFVHLSLNCCFMWFSSKSLRTEMEFMTAYRPTVVVLWCSNVDYVVPRLCAFLSIYPCCWIAEEVVGHDFLGILACPFRTLDGWVTSSSWLITSMSWGCNEWRRPGWSGRWLSRHGFIYICTLQAGGCGSSRFVKEAAFSFPGLACSNNCVLLWETLTFRSTDVELNH